MLNPDLYHGKLPWNKFEGWYFKISSDEDSFVFIPGISMARENPHSFVQLLDGTNKTFNYVCLPSEKFRTSESPFKVLVADLEFGLHGICGKIFDENVDVEVNIRFSEIVKWNPSGKYHGSMGFYNFLPFMQCYSQVCAIYMVADGYIIKNGIKRVFKKALAYCEKNWGNSFPYSWYWVQCSNFINKASLSVSAGNVPIPWGSFNGFLTGFYCEDVFYEFSTLNRSTFKADKSAGNLYMIFENVKSSLHIETESDKSDFVQLHAPDKGGIMKPAVLESISSKVKVTLFDKTKGEIIFKDTGINAGIEFGGKNS